MFTIEQYRPAHRSAMELLITIALFSIPVCLFYKNIKLYFLLLLPLVILSPMVIFLIIVYHVRPGLQLVVLILQTNLAEVREATQGYLIYFLPLSILYTSFYLYFIKKISFIKLPARTAFVVTAISVVFTGSYMFYNFKWYKKPITSNNFIQARHYPASILGGVAEAYILNKKNNIRNSASFTFNARKNNSSTLRQIYVFIIGESSRYDRWQVNGYTKPTSPRLAKRNNLISFPDVVAGSNLTWMSVPQMITRAHPEDIDIQFKEKSIISAFKEAGFKTIWLSNHPEQDLFWSGTINLHAKTANVPIFATNNSPNFEFEDTYDGFMLPLLDSLLKSDTMDVFVVMHTMGNHWDYSRRYPEDFDYFKPSGTTHEITPPSAQLKTVISNSYDNSIRYADFVIDSVIDMVDKQGAISFVSYLSDHGEDLFDASPSKIDFHLTPSSKTLHVPYFIWTSEQYNQVNPEKRQALTKNLHLKIGPENTFYTLLDLANVRFNGIDSTKSIASSSFRQSRQHFYNNSLQKPQLFTSVMQYK